MDLLGFEVVRVLVKLLWTEHHHVARKRNMMDHHVDEAGSEAPLAADQSIETGREISDHQSTPRDEMRDGQSGKEEIVSSFPATVEVLCHEVVEATLAEIDQLHQCEYGEGLVKHSQLITQDLMVPPISMPLHIVGGIQVVVAEASGNEIEVEAPS